jgi:hypothetical protein
MTARVGPARSADAPADRLTAPSSRNRISLRSVPRRHDLLLVGKQSMLDLEGARYLGFSVETSGLEPPTPCLQSRCSTN